jgi:hypothetical protein
MSRDASGNYTLPSGAGLNPVSVGQTISDTLWNTTFNDVATALTQSVNTSTAQTVGGAKSWSNLNTFASGLTVSGGATSVQALTATGMTISTSGLTVSAGGLIVSAGSTSVQALTATSGTFSSGVTVTGTLSATTLSGAISSAQVTNALGYTPPQPGGTGASGTWGINITGNAGSANTAAACTGNAATASALSGSLLNGTFGLNIPLPDQGIGFKLYFGTMTFGSNTTVTIPNGGFPNVCMMVVGNGQTASFNPILTFSSITKTSFVATSNTPTVITYGYIAIGY